MSGSERLSDLQIELAAVFFSLEEARGFVAAGGAALLASDLVDRTTEDLDLFAAPPIASVTSAKEALVEALREGGCDTALIQDGPSFCRMVVSRAEESTLVDLAIDSPPRGRPVITVLGPTLPPVELAGRKLLALFGRAEARDFADVYVLARRLGKRALIEQARALDPGFDGGVLAQMMATIARFDDDEIPLGADEVPLARPFFRAWAEELA